MGSERSREVMKTHHRSIGKDRSGVIVFTAEEPEDLWHIYNVLQPNDRLTASTVRNVKTESATGSVNVKREHFKIKVKVESTFFDETVCCLSAKGRNVEENRFVKMGQYHTIDLALNEKFTLEKDHWDSITVSRINEACDLQGKAEVGAVVMQEGLAHVCLVLSSLTIVKAKIQLAIPQKRRPDKYKEAMGKFFKKIVAAVELHLDLEKLKCVLIASPGFVRDEFLAHILAPIEQNRKFTTNREKFVSVHSSSGYKHSLTEVLGTEEVARRLGDTKASKEVAALEKFQNLLLEDGDRAFYGRKQVEKACELSAIEVLMVSDSLFRAFDVQLRKRMVRLVEKTKKSGAVVHIFSSLHPSGIQLSNLTGLAAILRYPLPEID